MRMYKAFSIVVLLVMGIVTLSGCQSSQAVTETAGTESATVVQEPRKPSPKPKPSQAGVPAIVVENPVHDFGDMGPGGRDNCEFRFKNTGTGELVIDRIQSTCGCTVPELKKKEYAPGEEGVVKVAFHASSVKTRDVKHLYIISNDPENPRTEITITAEVVVKVEIAPQNAELRLDRDNAGMPDLTVKGLDDRAFSIRQVIVSPEGAITVPFDSGKKATEFTLHPVVDKVKLNDNPNGTIQVMTDHPQSGTLVVRYQATPEYEVSRPRIILQNVVPGISVVKDVLIRSNYDKDVELESATSRNGYMEIESQEKDGRHLQLQVKITPPEQDSSSRRYITDELDVILKDGTKLTIRCSGWFKLN